MTHHPHNPGDDRASSIRIPMTFVKRGGRKLIITPGAAQSGMPSKPRIDNTLVKALARAFRWRKQLESGQHSTVEDIAAAEAINSSYVSRILRLTLLAPEIVEAILDGSQPNEITLAALMRPFPVAWHEQMKALLSAQQSVAASDDIPKPDKAEEIQSRKASRLT